MSAAPLRIVVAGAAGRMGQAVIKAVGADDRTVLTGAIERSGSPAIGRPVEDGLQISDAPPASGFDALIDFSAVSAVAANAGSAADAKAAYIACVTGIGAMEEAAIDAAASRVPVVQAGNTSLGVAVLAHLVERAAAALDEDYDIEIAEAHHRRKVDAPSGTALLLSDAAADGRGRARGAARDEASDDRSGARERGAFGFSVIRGGGVVGEHAVRLIGEREEIILSHRAFDRALFADGALAAARWAAGAEPGFYGMNDVLGLS